MASLVKCLSVRLRTKWFWVRVYLESRNFHILRLLQARSSLTFRQVWSVNSLNHFASLAKWLSVRLRTKWFWVRVQLQSLIFESIKALKIKTSMLVNLDFPSSTILQMPLFIFLNYWLIRFNSCSYCTNFRKIAEPIIPIGIPSKEAKAEIKIRPVITESKIRKYSI